MSEWIKTEHKKVEEDVDFPAVYFGYISVFAIYHAMAEKLEELMGDKAFDEWVENELLGKVHESIPPDIKTHKTSVVDYVHEHYKEIIDLMRKMP